jgi:hypothetical protein
MFAWLSNIGRQFFFETLAAIFLPTPSAGQ